MIIIFVVVVLPKRGKEEERNESLTDPKLVWIAESIHFGFVIGIIARLSKRND